MRLNTSRRPNSHKPKANQRGLRAFIRPPCSAQLSGPTQNPRFMFSCRSLNTHSVLLKEDATGKTATTSLRVRPTWPDSWLKPLQCERGDQEAYSGRYARIEAAPVRLPWLFEYVGRAVKPYLLSSAHRHLSTHQGSRFDTCKLGCLSNNTILACFINTYILASTSIRSFETLIIRITSFVSQINDVLDTDMMFLM